MFTIKINLTFNWRWVFIVISFKHYDNSLTPQNNWPMYVYLLIFALGSVV
jgi:hypothetical protein